MTGENSDTQQEKRVYQTDCAPVQRNQSGRQAGPLRLYRMQHTAGINTLHLRRHSRPPELCYIRLKLRECLGRRHDGSAWFADLCEAERWVGAARQCQLATDDRWHVCCYGPVVPWWRRKRLHRDRNESGSAGKVQESLTVKITPVKYQIIVNPMFPCQCGHAGTRLQAQLCHADFELQWQVRRAFSKGRFISRLKA